MLRISWLSLKLKSSHSRKNWRRPKRQRSKQRGLGIRLSKMGMTLEWQRPRKPSRLRSRGYVELTTPKRGIKPSTRLGLRLHLHLGGQRTSTTPLTSVGLLPPFRGLMLSPRWQRWARIAWSTLQPPLLPLRGGWEAWGYREGKELQLSGGSWCHEASKYFLGPSYRKRSIENNGDCPGFFAYACQTWPYEQRP